MLRNLAEVDYGCPNWRPKSVTAADGHGGLGAQQQKRGLPAFAFAAAPVRRPGAPAPDARGAGDAAQPNLPDRGQGRTRVALAVPDHRRRKAAGSGSSDAFTFTDARD
ncbi:MAG: hypothetical protein IPP62_18575 [bacterium]|nr:hypothetical protein [bacterium]